MRLAGSHDPRRRFKSSVPRRLVGVLMVLGTLGVIRFRECRYPVEIDVAKAAPLLLMEGHHGTLAFKPLRLTADRWPEGRVLVALVVAQDVARRSGSARNL